MSNPLQHALHNEKVCDYLHLSGKFSDWVVTSAYYAAIYFVSLELFPKQQIMNNNTGQAKYYHTFDDCYRDLYPREVRVDKHKARLELVVEYMPEIATDFKTLKDTCWTARYIDYQITPEIADTCRKILADIKDICSPTELAAAK